jgi:phosphoserine phosphatase
MDGTLLRSSASVELASRVGQLDAGMDIERRWAEGTITDQEFWGRLLDICQDASDADVAAAFNTAPWMEGVAETFSDIRARGEDIIVISQSPAFFVRGLAQWGAHETYGSAVEIGRPLPDSATLQPAAKVHITQAALARRNLSRHQCIAYGDSVSDLDLFATLPHTVAVNPSPGLAALAAARYDGHDLREAYVIGRYLVDSYVQRQHEGMNLT